MRTILTYLSILSLILLTSCFLFTRHIPCYDDPRDIGIKCLDTISYNPNNYDPNYQEIICSSAGDSTRRIMISSSGGSSTNMRMVYMSLEQDSLAVAYKPKDNFGTVVYKVPDTMKVGQTYQIKLRISKYNTPELILDIPNPTQKPIRIGKTMETRLVSLDDAFEIKTDNTPLQSVEMDSSYTEWEWFVKPTKSGDHYLRLLIIIKEENLTKDIPVYEGIIHVKSSPSYSILEFIKGYWQWLLGSIVFPIFAWWFVNNRKKKAKPKPKAKPKRKYIRR